MGKKNPYDFTIIVTVALLVTTGIVMVFSSSFSYAMVVMGDGYYFLKRILIWAAIGTFAMNFCARVKYWKWSKYANVILLGSVILLILVLTPLGKEVNGAKRWIGVGSITVMPSEIAKFAAIIFISTSVTRKKEGMQTFLYGVIPYLLIAGMFFGLIYKQPDFSTAFVVVVVIISMIFVGGMKLSHFIGLAASGFAALASMIGYIFISGAGYKAKRITAFIDPWADPSDSGFQAVQSLLALGSGGLFGRGLGRSVQKHFYLPEPQNDFIFAIIGEELGFIGGVAIMLLFMILIWRGIRIALNAPDLLSCLMATGITTMLIVQVVINIAVATSSMPVTGMPLPFISFGGNALVIFMACMGILLNISKYTNMNRS
ncbi:stage V sporulation protein E [Clostridium aceticum]|uniref:Probable peptidoglycan glycosyltransferase FtsW n=1 Tax=Clostridium aceticum TaxID=84022 RepID=A0A0D8I9S3_9CLOT|nr:putative lipid II flippase FtsW [Clostridium aceticum]AKL95626.1 stage V sporulation protein E [Clostridium aceticum]KJF26804.1 stage V sporulation protein E [Clostridium aceticum]